ncbi:MAG: hypothetical protein ACRENK_17015 [Gemmatimonadaceae bacterium]
MAEPPNALTLLVSAETEPLRIYDALVAHRCLTEKAICGRAPSLLVIEGAIGDFQSKPAMAGPTGSYVILLAMANAGLLNQHALERLNSLRVSQTLRARLRYFLQELWWQLRY